jgi:hypothetical protein
MIVNPLDSVVQLPLDPVEPCPVILEFVLNAIEPCAMFAKLLSNAAKPLPHFLLESLQPIAIMVASRSMVTRFLAVVIPL